jgi:hypothetical protein
VDTNRRVSLLLFSRAGTYILAGVQFRLSILIMSILIIVLDFDYVCTSFFFPSPFSFLGQFFSLVSVLLSLSFFLSPFSFFFLVSSFFLSYFFFPPFFVLPSQLIDPPSGMMIIIFPNKIGFCFPAKRFGASPKQICCSRECSCTKYSSFLLLHAGGWLLAT